MKRLAALILTAVLVFSGCARETAPESTPAPTVKPAPTQPATEPATTPPTQPVQAQIPPEVLQLVDYSLILSALEEMGCANTLWDVVDVEYDGHPELIVETFASESGFPSQILVDALSFSAESYTATGAAQTARFCFDEQGNFGLLTGYYGAAGEQEFFYLWSGYHWTQVPIPTDPYGNPMPEEHSYFPVSLRCPDLRIQTSPADPDATAAHLNAAFLSRGAAVQYLTLDFDCDGTEEHLFLITGATNLYFQGIAATNFWGDELHAEYRDDQISAVVINTLADRTWVRTVRLGPDALMDLTVSEDGITIDDRSYVYQSSGTAFVPAS